MYTPDIIDYVSFPFGVAIYRVEFWAKDYGMKFGAVGNKLGASL